MVERLRGLYELQGLDLDLDEARRRLKAVESALGESEGLQQARQALAQAQESQRLGRQTLRLLEMDLAQVMEKLKASEETLYGGRVRNPKELAGLEKEVEALQRRARELEDETLEAMIEAEKADQGVKEEQARLERVEEAWGQEQARFLNEKGKLSQKISKLERQRRELVATIDAEDLSLYDDLRRRKGGEGVVLVKDGVCQGCGVALPTSKVSQLRQGQELIHCTNCERILYLEE